MFKFLLILCCTAPLGLANDLPWLGVILSEVPREERVGLTLEPGVGLKVTSVSPDGPYQKSLGQKGDLWWKFDGQILLSRCQMVILLRTKKVGDEVEV